MCTFLELFQGTVGLCFPLHGEGHLLIESRFVREVEIADVHKVGKDGLVRAIFFLFLGWGISFFFLRLFLFIGNLGDHGPPLIDQLIVVAFLPFFNVNL
jgi:hypothetical protein